jgi:N-acyl-D-amino-acid deacylase
VLLFANAIVFDGTGRDPVIGSVVVKDGRIDAIVEGTATPPMGDGEVVDCRDLALAPGFIDVHSHSDIKLLHRHPAKTDQGVTAEVVGNCGFSAFPCGGRAAEVREYGNAILSGGEEAWEWPHAKAYLADAERRSADCHVQSLVGHGTLRTAVAGSRQGALTAAEMDQALGLLRESFEQGATGISTGLMYAPGSSAPREELLEICKLTARMGKIYTTHMRSYSDDLLPSIQEQLDLARESGCRLQISHLQTVGRRNWDKQVRALDMLQQARQDGIDVEFDSYPYLAGSTVMTQLLPQWTLDGGAAAMVARLTDAAQREQILAQMKVAMPQRWSDIIVAGVASEKNQHMVGSNVEALATAAGHEPAEFALDLMVEEQGQVSIVSFNQSDENLRALLTNPLCTVISDGFYVRGRPHPRLYGTFPSLLGELCRDRMWMTMPEAIYRITGKPAERFGLAGRGRIAVGYRADLVLFDPESIASQATYDAPEQAPLGIRAVYRDGHRVPVA